MKTARKYPKRKIQKLAWFMKRIDYGIIKEVHNGRYSLTSEFKITSGGDEARKLFNMQKEKRFGYMIFRFWDCPNTYEVPEKDMWKYNFKPFIDKKYKK